MKYCLVSNRIGSSSLKRLAEGLSTKLGYKVWRRKTPNLKKKNIVYGDCKDKLYQYQWFKQNEISSPEFTTEKSVAQSWLEEGYSVFARTLLRACEGKGIIVLEENGNKPVPNAPVYTKYKKKKKEFRIHVYNDTVVAVLEKRKKKDFEGERETKIRNTANGYVFCSNNVEEPEGLRELALKASKVTQSHFKGVDIGWNEKNQELFVIEVNSAPGIEGSNISKYVEAIVK